MKNIMSVVWAAGKIGVAFYEVESTELFVLPDVAEGPPDFDILRCIFNQFKPKYIMVSSRQDERLIKVLKELCDLNEQGTRQDDTGGNRSNVSSQTGSVSSVSTSRSSVPENRPGKNRTEDSCSLLMLAGKVFAPDPCKMRLQSQILPGEPKSHTPAEHLIYITSLIPFTSEMMVRAAGALLRFLDTQGIELFQIELSQGHIPVLDIKLFQMDDLVLVDDTAWNSLQIFNSERHPASTKQGVGTGSKEGLSVYSLLNRCATAQGSKYLKQCLSRPTRNLELLRRRFEVIEHCYSPVNAEFVKNATECLRNIKSFPQLLFKLSILHASVKEWKDLYQSIYHCMLLTEILSWQPPCIQLFDEIRNPECVLILKSIVQEMMRIYDFEESKLHNRFVPRNGIDSELDKKRQQYSCLPNVMSLVASEEITHLPDYVQQCSIVYIPEVGYLVAVNFWKDELSQEELMLPGLDYKFTSQQIGYYKSQRTRELDVVLGDCQVAILDMETSLMIFLTESILKHKAILLKIGLLTSELDSLLSMAAVARENGYVRPTIVDGGGVLNIQDGKHPLVDLVAEFVHNSTEFEGDEKIVILTGPNASGKSVYLKQVGIIVMMALCGSFVPASAAWIPAYDRVCTRIHARESVSFGLSTFMMDVNQMSLALRTSTKNSLVIIDEFGKGTAEADGLSLLVATIENFIERQEDCPTIFLSTHFYSLLEHLQNNGRLKYQTMEFTEEEGYTLVYLFRIKNGTCTSSFAHSVAHRAGISPKVIERSKEMEYLIRQQLGAEVIKPLPPKEKEAVMQQIADEFFSLNFDEVDCMEYMTRITNRMAPYIQVPVESTPSTPAKDPSTPFMDISDDTSAYDFSTENTSNEHVGESLNRASTGFPLANFSDGYGYISESESSPGSGFL